MVKIVDNRPRLVYVSVAEAPLVDYSSDVEVSAKHEGKSVLERLSHLIHPGWHGLSAFTAPSEDMLRGKFIHPHVLPLVTYHSRGNAISFHAYFQHQNLGSKWAQQLIVEHPAWVERLGEDFLRFAGSVVVYSALFREKLKVESGGDSVLLGLKPELFDASKQELFDTRNGFRASVAEFFRENLKNGVHEARLQVIEHAAQVALAVPYADYSRRQRKDFIRICVSGIISEIKVYSALQELGLSPQYSSIEDDFGDFKTRHKPKFDIVFDLDGSPEAVQVKTRTRSGEELFIARPNQGVHQLSVGPGKASSPVQFSKAVLVKLERYFDIYSRTGHTELDARASRGGNRKKGFSRDYYRPYGRRYSQ